MDEKDENQGFTLEDIMREFGSGSEDAPEENADPAAETPAEDTPPAAEPEKESEEQPEAPVSGDTVRLDGVIRAAKPQVSSDTVRLDAIPQGLKGTPAEASPVEEPETPAEPEKPKAEPFSENWEPEYDEPMGDYVPPEPIVFRPRQRLRELKKALVAGPEKRYYDLAELGLGKLQLAIFGCLVITLLSAASTVMYALDMVQPQRMKLLIFFQVLSMLLAALMGSHRLLEGAGDLLRKRFSLNTLLLVTFLACCADAVFCLIHEKVPCCAAFSLEMTMSLWGACQRRSAEMGQMDTLRKAVRLDSIVSQKEMYEGRPGFLRAEGQVADFMDNYDKVSGPEKVLNGYALAALAAAVAVGAVAGVTHSVLLGVRAFAAALLAALPATIFITLSRPAALLEKRLHKLGTVICGWQGVRGLSENAVYPLNDYDLFPLGSAKMNGVKFYGDRDPEEVIAYAAALMGAGTSGLAPLFTQLLESRNGHHYDAENLRSYGNGGIGGEVCGEPVLIGILPFLQDMGVEIPEGTRVNQALYLSIDGQLSALFAITYSKNKSSTAGLTTLCSYRRLTPVVVAGDFMLTESFLGAKFGIKTRRIAFPNYADRAALAARTPDEGLTALAMTTMEGLAPAAYAVTGARALRSASQTGVAIHLVGGILGLGMMLALAILGAEDLLTPGNLFAYELIWMIPGLLITEWTRSV